MATRNIKPATQTNAPKLTTTTNGNKLGEQTSKLLQIETNGEAKEQEVAETEVIELKSTRSSPPMLPKEQKPIQPPPPSIAVNESRYILFYPSLVCIPTSLFKNKKLLLTRYASKFAVFWI